MSKRTLGSVGAPQLGWQSNKIEITQPLQHMIEIHVKTKEQSLNNKTKTLRKVSISDTSTK